MAAALLFSGQALADGDAPAADDMLLLGGAVDESELAGERGTSGIAIAVNDVEQTVNNSIDIDAGGNVINTNGDVLIESGARTGNMSITSINTGNNVGLTQSFVVNMYFGS